MSRAGLPSTHRRPSAGYFLVVQISLQYYKCKWECYLKKRGTDTPLRDLFQKKDCRLPPGGTLTNRRINRGQNKKKRIHYHFRLDSKTAKRLDTAINRMGYPSRSSFFTAAAYAALGEENTDAGADADANADENANA